MADNYTGSTETRVVRFAPYLEDLHKQIIQRVRPLTFDTSALLNPFAAFTPWDLDQLYMDNTVGMVEQSYPKLFDLYNDHLLGLDLMGLYSQAIEKSVNARNLSNTGTVINDMVRARQAWMIDEYDSKIEPRLTAGFRDLNSVMSSQFTTARAIVLRDHERQLNDFTAQLQLRFAEYGVSAWGKTIEWHEKIPMVYGQSLNTYTAQRIDIEKHNFELAAKCCLWPYTTFGYLTQLLSSMAGATTTTASVAGESPSSTGGGRLGGIIGGAISGAVAGSVVPGVGTVIGGVVGAIGGLFSS